MALTVGQANPGTLTMGSVPAGSRAGQVYWTGQDGNVWLREASGKTTNLGTPKQAKVWDLGLNGAQEIDDPVANKAPASNTTAGTGGGYVAPPKVLDTAQLGSLDSLINSLGTTKDQQIGKAAIKRDTSKREKEEERTREEGKYQGKKLGVLQDFAGAKTDTDLNTRNTLENLISALSTLGLGGSRALTRQLLDASNMSNRKANSTQARNNQGLDSSWNEYSAGNDNDQKKIQDQYGYDEGEANRTYLQGAQNATYKKADVYGNFDDKATRQTLMNEGDAYNSRIAGSSFMNPSYTGAARAAKTPDLDNYMQDIAKYDTTNIGANDGGLTPDSANGANVPGNLAVQAIAVNDKDLGIKKRTEADLGYGV